MSAKTRQIMHDKDQGVKLILTDDVEGHTEAEFVVVRIGNLALVHSCQQLLMRQN